MVRTQHTQRARAGFGVEQRGGRPLRRLDRGRQRCLLHVNLVGTSMPPSVINQCYKHAANVARILHIGDDHPTRRWSDRVSATVPDVKYGPQSSQCLRTRGTFFNILKKARSATACSFKFFTPHLCKYGATQNSTAAAIHIACASFGGLAGSGNVRMSRISARGCMPCLWSGRSVSSSYTI